MSTRHDDFSSQTTNPANLRLSWKSSEKRFVCYDTITKQKTTLGNIEFVVLHETISISGFNEKEAMGIFSNEIKNIQSEELVVRTKNGILVEGYYADIKAKLSALGGSFTNNLYIQLKGGDLAVLQVSGAPLKTWFEYKEKNGQKVSTHWVTITGVDEQKRGSVKYCTPTLTLGELLTKSEDTQAEELCIKIKTYRRSLEAPKSLEDIKTKMDDIPY